MWTVLWKQRNNAMRSLLAICHIAKFDVWFQARFTALQQLQDLVCVHLEAEAVNLLKPEDSVSQASQPSRRTHQSRSSGASHHGRFWECLSKVILGLTHEQTFTDDGLMTFLAEFESILKWSTIYQIFHRFQRS